MILTTELCKTNTLTLVTSLAIGYQTKSSDNLTIYVAENEVNTR
jgi:uncharacterized linocin/CFP29 family protein